MPELEYTGTVKLQKGRLRAEGVYLNKIRASGSTERLYWLPPGLNEYVPFTDEEWANLKTGDIKS
jgi:hypothetical protein